MGISNVIGWLKVLEDALVEIGTEAGVHKGKIGKCDTTRLFDLAEGARRSRAELRKPKKSDKKRKH